MPRIHGTDPSLPPDNPADLADALHMEPDDDLSADPAPETVEVTHGTDPRDSDRS